MPKDVALRYQKIGLEKVLQDGPAAQRFVFTFRPDLADLLGSVRKAGLLVPPVLREAGGGLYQIVCGWRRIQAVRSLGVESIEALIGSKEELADEACLRRSLLENRFHRGFNEIEKAMVFVRLQDEFPSFLPRLGDVLEGDLRFPQDASALEDRRFLLSLPEPTRLRIATGQLSYGQALLLREFPAGCRDLFCDLMAGCALNLQESRQAAQWIRQSQRPLIVAGGGVHYSDATAMLRQFVERTGIPVGETQAGKGSLPYDHPLNLGAIGVTGTLGANRMARDADLVIGIGTRYSDFTTASKTAFQNPKVRFININVAEFDAYKHSAIPLVGDARVTLEELLPLLEGWQVAAEYRALAAQYNREWDAEVQRIYTLEHGPLISQGEVIGVVNTLSRPQDVVLCAAGSLPGDLHKLWRTRDPKGYHLEYGYSCMGYEIAGGMGAKLAAPERDIYVMVGDGSYLMMNSEIATMAQEGIKVIIVVLDNHGFASIGGLSKSVGSDGFGTKYRYRTESGHLDGDVLPIDYAANAASLGAHVIRAHNRDDLAEAIRQAQAYQGGPVCIVIEVDRRQRVGGYESWWDVAVAEVSENPDVQRARAEYVEHKKRERHYLGSEE